MSCQQVETSQFISGLSAILPSHRGCVATIGSFDGVHLGHQAIISRLISEGRSRGLPSLVMVFEPQPYEFFSREKAPPRLMRLREKVAALIAQGVDRVLCVKFAPEFRRLSAQAFIDLVLVEKLGISHLVIGDDFRFGCDRAGDFKLLQREGAKQGFTVSDTDTLEVEDGRASSTRVRELLEQNQLDVAARLLGKPFSICGRVIYGRQLGRTIGVPTANVGLGRHRSPVRGVFAVSVELEGQELSFQGVANVGVKPTVDGRPKPLLEVHIFDFDKQLYGQFIRVNFFLKIREERKFASVEALKEQITLDIEHSKAYFRA